MAYGTPTDPVGGTVITVSFAVSNILDPIRWLRLMTGNADPPGSAYVVVSTSTTGTSWQKIPTDALADLGVTAAKLSAGAGSSGQLLGMVGTALGWFSPLSLAVSSANTATNASNVTTTIGGVSLASYNAPSASLAADASSLGGHLAALYALLASPAFTGIPTRNGQTVPMYKVGLYAGGGGGFVNKPTGFVPTFVGLYGTNGTASVIVLMRSSTSNQNVRLAGTSGTSLSIAPCASTGLDGSDGFNVGNADFADTSGYSYYWIALG